MQLEVGQKVRLRDTGEVGVVVYLWINEHGDEDTYVAFFGNSYPDGEPTNTPYILRYFATSLERQD